MARVNSKKTNPPEMTAFMNNASTLAIAGARVWWHNNRRVFNLGDAAIHRSNTAAINIAPASARK